MDSIAAQAYILSSDMLAEIVEFRGAESGGHVGRIRRITRILLEQATQEGWYGVSTEQLDKISAAAALHDIGKIGVPEQVLLKPGKLTPIEYRMMQTHPVKGWEILNRMTEVQDKEYHQYCCDICRFHHERWDGSGYPDHLEKDAVPFWAQVVALADVYDALVSKRVYKSAYTHEKTCHMIANGDCGPFGPFLLQCFENAGPALCKALNPLRE